MIVILLVGFTMCWWL